jgi:hypothetical protein
VIAQKRRHGAGGLFLALHDGKGISETSHRYSRATQKSHGEGVRIGFSFAREMTPLNSGRH